jgi:NDP-sugar pyrophosphorylase family protein
VVLAAGEGMRLRPITEFVPKPLCPVGNVPLLDRALGRLAAHGIDGPSSVAVNVFYMAEVVAAHVGGRAHVSREPGPTALGTAGALWHLRDWIAGRGVLALNSDAYLSDVDDQDLAPLLDSWDGRTVRVLTVPARDRTAEFGEAVFAGASLLPADLVAAIPPGRAELVLEVWRPAERAGRLETVPYGGTYFDTGTPVDFLAANMHAIATSGLHSLVAPSSVVSGRIVESIVGAGAVVAGTVTRSVIFPGAQVAADEVLVDAIRLGRDVTVAGL